MCMERMMKAAGTAEIRVETHGRVARWAVSLATAKVGAALQVAAEPVLSARVTLAEAADPAVSRPAIAQATVDMNGHIIRAQAAGVTMRLAIEELQARLRVRLGRAARNWAAMRGTVPTGAPRQWRHQDIPERRPPYFPRPRDERAVIARSSYAAGPQTPAEAAAELDLLDYDFHLFTERSTGQDAMIDRVPGGYRLALARGTAEGMTGPLPGSVTISTAPVPTLTIADAIGLLDASGEVWLFFTDEGTGRGSVIYHRYDGHYGLLVSGLADGGSPLERQGTVNRVGPGRWEDRGCRSPR